MKKIVCISLAVVALSMMGATASYAYHGGHGGHVGVGVWVGPGWGPGWWGPYYPYYPYNPYYAAPPVVVTPQQPDTYVQPEQQKGEPSYWYYCPDPKGYYPYLKKCPKGWMKVVPPSSPEEEEE